MATHKRASRQGASPGAPGEGPSLRERILHAIPVAGHAARRHGLGETTDDYRAPAPTIAARPT
eukprot:8275753-Lingulodinium_polyedra.AAC.1